MPGEFFSIKQTDRKPMYFVFGLQTVKKVTSDAGLIIRMECL